jgi:hypothetical protein
MRDELMAEEVIIDPFVGPAPMRTAEKAVIKGVCRREVVDRDGEVKGRRGIAHALSVKRVAAKVDSGFVQQPAQT